MNTGDLRGGLAAAVVVIPQAMAFGATLWVLAGGSAADGAFVGLLSAMLLSFFTGLSGGCSGIICSPTGPSLVLLSGGVAAMHAAGLPFSAITVGIAASVLLAGVLQILAGYFNGGQLIKYIPHPVIAGFMTGSAFLMIRSQLPVALGGGWHVVFEAQTLPPVIAAVSAFVAMFILPRLTDKIPATLAGLVVGIAAFHLACKALGFTPKSAWLVGALPSITNLKFQLNADALTHLPWRVIALVAASLALLASLNTLLTSVVADVSTGARHDARRVLIGQGISLVANGLAGGIGGSATTGATLVAVQSGGRRWAGVCMGLMLAVIVIFAGKAAAWVPLSALAGIILYIAVFGLIELDIAYWMLHKRTRPDAYMAILVTVVTVAYDLVTAVALGVGLAVIRFVNSQIKAPVVHLRTTAVQRASTRHRTAKERQLLAEHGERIVSYELTGNLFFGAVDRLFEEIRADLDRPAWVILDMARVTQFDLSAIKLLQQMANRLHKQGGELIFATVRSGRGLGKKVQKTLKKISPYGKNSPIRTFIDGDEAIEYAENALLRELGETSFQPHQVAAIEDISLFSGLDLDQLTIVKKHLSERHVSKNSYLFQMGDTGDELFIVLSGEVDILLPFGERHYKRIATFGPGTYFGEVAFLNPGQRSASAKVTYDVHLLVLDNTTLDNLSAECPAAALLILKALAKVLSEHLRWADVELKQLMDW